jgi:hypothetical protein
LLLLSFFAHAAWHHISVSPEIWKRGDLVGAGIAGEKHSELFDKKAQTISL